MTGTDWIRSPQAKALLWAAFALSLVFGAALVVVDRQEVHAADPIAAPLTDDQAAAHVVGSARQIVAAAHLQGATGGYTFVAVRAREQRYPSPGGAIHEFCSAASRLDALFSTMSPR